MRLARPGPPGAERPVVVTDGEVLDLSGVTDDVDGACFARGGLEQARAARAAGTLPVLPDAASLPDAAPIARPGAVPCTGMDDAAHAAESGASAPEQPVVLLQTPNTVGGPDDGVAVPRGSTGTDWEVELGVVVGRRASRLSSPAESLAHVAGFVVVDDLSERAFQLDASTAGDVVEVEVEGLGRQRHELVREQGETS